MQFALNLGVVFFIKLDQNNTRFPLSAQNRKLSCYYSLKIVNIFKLLVIIRRNVKPSRALQIMYGTWVTCTVHGARTPAACTLHRQ